MDYDTLNHFAKSWGLLLLLAAFVVGVAFALRPSRHYSRQADIPFRLDDEDIGDGK